ncbi:phenylalanine--tRNA ligase subunit beta [Planctobacterium marinum]|uniref:phenylalanine--tRNA ligase subunit beta n=1 Tax=Planctobacterium marinum TaxID=1631968 RepID=UPI001E54E312|nr:phenylalanine--tRNA ligase subunit beta [Planctobacterium marinum]MCC2604404.1 phenylalanine--tRNA ligase subunit beta [Planctobacterium marinum]
MKFSEKWLRDWVNPAISTDELVAQITMAGLEVDSVDAVAGEFSGVVVGEVVECGQHPDADKLRVTKVNVGGDELLDIVCGAPNCRQGLKVAVATVGAVLPGNFKIKKAKLRGQPSFGMLCSFSELQISDDHDGIIELPSDAPVGLDIREYLNLDDVSIEVDLTPNRSDCLGIRGLAREVGVLNNADVTEVQAPPVAPGIDESRSITLEAPEACPRYLGRVIKGINLEANSPTWLTERLRRSGVRAIDPVVDVTNYVLLELGHPMHAFDLAKLEGGIKVRFAQQDESLTLLDGNEVKLQSNTLVIADEHKPLAMAGIFGGLDSGVSDGSVDIFLESAFFAPLAIAGKARQYGLHTDASHRYERGVDPQLQKTAMERATQLLLDIVGGEAGPVVEAVSDSHIPAAKKVCLRQSRLARVLGIEIPAAQVTELLQRSGFDTSFDDSAWQCLVPAYRFDIAIEEDLIEEVARIYGYNNIPNVAPVASLAMPEHRESALNINVFKDVLVANDYQEAITYSFVDPKAQGLLFADAESLILPHPISADMSAMRLSLLPGLLKSVSYNQNRQQSRIRLFETGLRFVPDTAFKVGVRQEEMIAGVIAGDKAPEYWNENSQKVDFFDIKGDVERLLSLTGSAAEYQFKKAEHSAMHPGQTAAIYLGEQLVGYVGAVHPKFEKPLALNGRTYVFELLLTHLNEAKLPKAKPLSRFPANRRDIAIIVDEAINASEVLQVIEKFGTNLLVGLNLFDVYRGDNIGKGKKSLALSLTLQDVERTLEESEIQSIVNGVVEKLTEEFNASLRE